MFFILFNSKPLYLRAQTELEQDLDIYIDVEFCQESIFRIPGAIPDRKNAYIALI